MESKEKKRGIIRYVLNTQAKDFDKALSPIIKEIESLNKSIISQEKQVVEAKNSVAKEGLKLREILEKRNQCLEILKRIGVIGKKKLKDLEEEDEDFSPSEMVSLNNPKIEIFLDLKELSEKEEKERGQEAKEKTLEIEKKRKEEERAKKRNPY